ncbi:hypothetical protein V5N11_022224 [Cardamine amara subsp. amara]|uniref:RNase H type-1 domain-containing protein n=1 Tax=Cardamine amara subsp. amara TaxID=228776 RepID=A0ABD1BLW7_CARAN
MEVLTKAIIDARTWESAQAIADGEHQSTCPKTTHSARVADLSVDAQGALIGRVDAAWRADCEHAGLGWSFFNAEDQIVNQGSKSQNFVSSALMGEALAVREALDSALELGLVTLHLESDSKLLIDTIRSTNFAH